MAGMKIASESSARGSGSTGMQLPLIECPRCGVRLIVIRSKQEASYIEVFIKCPNNIKEDPRTCGFIKFEAEYAKYLQQRYQQCNREDGDGHGFKEARGDEKMGLGALNDKIGDLNHHMGDLRHQMGDLRHDMGDLKHQIGDLKQQKCEPKQQLATDLRVLVAVCVGVVIGMLVSVMWK